MYPNIDDLDIAIFILKYTKQEYNNIPDCMVLQTLDFKEITCCEEYIMISENGSQTNISKETALQSVRFNTYAPLSMDSWKSENGYMRIVTNCSLTNTVGNKKYYTVSATATWLKMPICLYTDVLSISHTGNFDSSKAEFAYKYQTNACCSSKFKHNDSTNFPNDRLV